MPKSFTKNEKIVLLAVLKYIISTDGVITESEIDDINDIAEDKGFEDFQEIFNEVDEKVTSLEVLKSLIRNIENDSSREKILDIALEVAHADAEVNPHEIEILKFMSKEWGISLKS